MATVSDIVARVQRRVIDLPTAVQTEVQTLVEKAHRELQERHNFTAMERRESRTTAVGSNSLGTIDLAGGGPGSYFKEYHETDRPFWMDDNGQIHFLEITFDEAEARRVFLNSDEFGRGQPRVLIHRHGASTDGIDDDEWRVLPYPDGLAQTATGEYTIQIPYYRYSPFPSSRNWVTDRYDWYLTFKATADAFSLNWDPEKQAIFEQMAEREFQRARSLDARLRTSFSDTLEIHTGPRAGKLRL